MTLPARSVANLRLGAVLVLLSVGVGCARNARPDGANGDFLGEGVASFYGPGLYGRKTASGERLQPGTFTAAHRTLRFGSCLRVVNLSNGRSTRVRVNDRGPFVASRIVDVSESAARSLGMVGRGVTRVRLYKCAQGEWAESEAAWDLDALLADRSSVFEAFP